MNFKKILICLMGTLVLVGGVAFISNKKVDKTIHSASHIEKSKIKDNKEKHTIEKDIKKQDTIEKDTKKQDTIEKDTKKQDDTELVQPNKSEKKVDTPAHMQRWIEGHCYIGDGHNHPEDNPEGTTEEKDNPVKEKCPIQEGCDIVGGHGHLDEDEVVETKKSSEIEDKQVEPTKPSDIIPMVE